METRSETDILGRRWYRIDVLKGEKIYDRVTLTAESDEAAELQAHREAISLARVGRSRLIAEVKAR